VEPRDGHAVCTLRVPLTSPYPPFLLKQNLSPKVIAGSASQDESFMPDISGYIWETVKV